MATFELFAVSSSRRYKTEESISAILTDEQKEKARSIRTKAEL